MKYMIVGFVFLFKFFSFGQVDTSNVEHSDLIEWGIKGKVKSIQLLVYRDIKVTNDVPLPLDSLAWNVKTIVYYNREGNTDSILSYGRADDGDSVLSRTTYSYSGKEYTAYSDKQRFAPNEMRRIWNDSHSYLVDVYEDGALVTKIVTHLDQQFRVSEITESYFDEDKSSPIIELKRRYSFDRKGYLLKIEEDGGAEKEKTKVSNFEFDGFDNPIKSYRIINDGEVNFLTLRSFEYYD